MSSTVQNNISWETLFADEKAKIEAFDRIAEKYFDRNFGRMKKEDVDLLMFDILCDAVRAHVAASDDVQSLYSSNSPYSDFQLSYLLGITETRIRSLKEKDWLVYKSQNSDSDWWKEALKECISGSYSAPSEGKCRFAIPDKSVRNALENQLSTENGGFLEYTLNSEVVSIRVDQMYLVVCYAYDVDPNEFIAWLDDEGINKFKLKKIFNKLKNILCKESAGNKANTHNERFKRITEQLQHCYEAIDESKIPGYRGRDDIRDRLKYVESHIPDYLISVIDIIPYLAQ